MYLETQYLMFVLMLLLEKLQKSIIKELNPDSGLNKIVTATDEKNCSYISQDSEVVIIPGS